MRKELHMALQTIAHRMGEGSQIFILDQGHYHKFRVEGGKVRHIGSHSNSHVENGNGCLSRSNAEMKPLLA